MRSTPARVSPSTYPIAATATALAYDFAPQASPSAAPQSHVSAQPDPVAPVELGQQPLFAPIPVDPRVIPFDSLTTPEQRESIRVRGAGLERPAPVKTETVQVRHARAQKRQAARTDQRRLEFDGHEQVLTPPQSSIICDAPVAPPSLRMRAAAIDGALMLAGSAASFALFRYFGGHVPVDKHILPFFFLALITVPLFYRVLWTFVGQDTIGLQKAGLRLIDFDGNPPSRERRYQRLFGGVISFLAAGMGLIWAFVDEDALTWHDHMSGTFPTLISE